VQLLQRHHAAPELPHRGCQLLRPLSTAVSTETLIQYYHFCFRGFATQYMSRILLCDEEGCEGQVDKHIHSCRAPRQLYLASGAMRRPPAVAGLLESHHHLGLHMLAIRTFPLLLFGLQMVSMLINSWPNGLKRLHRHLVNAADALGA